MSNLYIILAISNSGKSTWCKSVVNNRIKLVSLDEIKKASPNESSHLKAFKLINEYLKTGDVLFDANNCKLEHRKNLLKAVYINCKKYLIKFDVDLEKCLNFTSKKYAAKEIIKRQYKEYITDIDKLEGFEVITKEEFYAKYF